MDVREAVAGRAAVIPRRWARYYLENAPSLVWLIVANLAAVLVGVRFYVEDMPAVSTFLWPLFTDSPVAVGLIALSLTTLLPNLSGRLEDVPHNRVLPYLHTLAFAWLVKTGLWTVFVLNYRVSAYFPDAWGYFGIVLTHLGFVLEAYLVPHYAKTSRGALLFAGLALAVNDVLDWGLGYYPPLRYQPDLGVVVGSVAVSALTLALTVHAFDRADE
jgi:uncharacterized membrane protein YpjA